MKAPRKWCGTLQVVVTLAVTTTLVSCSSHHHTTTQPAQPSSSSTTATPPSPSTTATPSPGVTATPSIAPRPPGGPVPPNFQTQSATFVSPTSGWVLGTAPCQAAPCTSIVTTGDRGQHWAGLPAPRAALSPDGIAAGVSEIRFADSLNGWVYGPDLWATHDGGATWHQVRLGSQPIQVDTLEAAGGFVYAVAGHCATDRSCQNAQLWRAAVGGDAYSLTAGVSLPGSFYFIGGLALRGRTAYVVTPGSSPAGLWATDDGTTWAVRPNPCPTSLALGLASVAPIDATHAVSLCSGNGAAGSTDKRLYASADTGRSFPALPTPAPRGGDGGTLAAATASTFGLASSSAAAWIYLTNDGAQTWTTALQINDGGAGFGDFGFQDSTHGLAVHAPIARLQRAGGTAGVQSPATLFLTADGGRSWAPIHY